MSEANVNVVHTFLDALTRGDVKTVLSCLAPDGVIDEGHGLPFSGRYTGTTGAMELLGNVSATLGMKVDSFQVRDSGDLVTATLNITYTSNATGRAVSVVVAELYTVVDGLITLADVYYKDPAAVMDLSTNG